MILYLHLTEECGKNLSGMTLIKTLENLRNCSQRRKIQRNRENRKREIGVKKERERMS
jgi:hypothetical protein